MKKLLSVLAAVGLTATASTAVVACATTIKAKDVKITSDGDATVTDKKIDLVKAIDNDVTTGTELDGYKLFDNKKNEITGSNLVIKFAKDYKKKDVKKGKKVEVTITFHLDASKYDKKATVYVGTEKSGKTKMDKAATKLNIPAKKDWNATNGGGTPVNPDKAAISSVAYDGNTTVTIKLTKAFDGTITESSVKIDNGVSVTAAKLDDKKTTITATISKLAPEKKTTYTVTVVGIQAGSSNTFSVDGSQPTPPAEKASLTAGQNPTITDASKATFTLTVENAGSTQPGAVTIKGTKSLNSSATISGTTLTVTISDKLTNADNGDYTVTVANFDGTAKLNVNIPAPAKKASLTAGQKPTITDASKASFTLTVENAGSTQPGAVTISGSKTLNGTATISGSTITVTISDTLTEADNGDYTVTVANFDGTATLTITITAA